MPDPMPELATSLTVTETDRLLQAESAVRGFCGWHIAPEVADAVLTVIGSGDRSIFLPTLWLTAVTDITFAATADEAEEIVDIDLVTWTRAGEVHVGDWWGRPRERTLTITFTHGHDPIPPDIAGVVRGIASRIPADGTSAIKARTTGPFSETYDLGDLNSVDEKTLSRYRIPRSR